jgi:hypothetical protein
MFFQVYLARAEQASQKLLVHLFIGRLIVVSNSNYYTLLDVGRSQIALPMWGRLSLGKGSLHRSHHAHMQADQKGNGIGGTPCARTFFFR